MKNELHENVAVKVVSDANSRLDLVKSRYLRAKRRGQAKHDGLLGDRRNYTYRKAYLENVEFRQKIKSSKVRKYHLNINYRAREKAASIRKYRDSILQRDRVKRGSVLKYRDNVLHRERVKTGSFLKFRDNALHRERVRTGNVLKYRDNALHRERTKAIASVQTTGRNVLLGFS